jgi:hypothetical protein
MKHEPSAEEIAALAAIIREGWSEREHRRRAGQDPDATWTVPVIDCGLCHLTELQDK